MSFRFMRRLVVPLFLLISIGVMAQSEQDNAPIFLWVRGDLWRVDPADLTAAPEQITEGGTISAPVLSPDGDWIAYKAAAQVGIEALDRLETEGLIADFDLPSDLFVLNVVTGESRPLVGQPENPSLFVDGVPDRATSRSAPVWSPDGTTLAWAQIDFGSPQAALVILNRETMNGISAPITMEVFGIPPNIVWQGETISVWLTLPTGITHVERFTAEGIPTELMEIPQESIGGSIEGFYELSGRTLILNDQGEWREIFADASSGVVPSPMLTVAGAENAYRIGFGHVAETGFFWEAFDPLTPDATSVAFPGVPARVTLSPDGRSIAFLGFPEFGAAAIYRDGELFTIPNTGDDAAKLNVGAILWGTPIWLSQ